MASMLETPSRIWRRIEAEGSRDMPSLPSVPGFDDSAEISISSDDLRPYHGEYEVNEEPSFGHIASPIHSTPAASSHHASTVRATSSTSSTTRFAHSLARSGRSSLAHSSISRALSARQRYPDSFEISAIPSLPDDDIGRRSDCSSGEIDDDLVGSRESAPEEYTSDRIRTPMDEDANFDVSLTNALESISSPYQSEPERGRTPKEQSYIDYEVSLKSSPKPTPLSSKFRHVSMRRPMLERTRTPSLSRTSLSPVSSPSNSTPRSGRSLAMDRSTSVSPIQGLSIPLPPSHANSPAPQSPEPNISLNQSEPNTSTNTQSMDITDAHDSPIRYLAESGSEAIEGRDESVERSVADEEDTSEHTFSTDDGPTPHAVRKNENSRSPEGLASAFSSPATSMATPTPAFTRPRARFNLPEGSSSDESHDAHREDHAMNGEEMSLEEPMTPQTRRRSFFLSVINSTTRPRMKFPTPHPRDRIVPDTPSMMDVIPGPASRSIVQHTPIAFPSAFAGATPRPRFKPSSRLSHPLAQAHTLTSSSSTSESEPGEETDGTVRPENNDEINNEHLPWSTPAPVASVAHLSPYDEAALNGASFVSTASSHDLTTHPRANTSFDPAMGFGGNAPGHGVGRFNANKLNTYLHGLNRKLQEENEALMERNRILEETQGKSTSIPPTPVASAMGSRRQSGGSRRLSAVSNLGDLQEEANEAWMEEKAELEEMVDAFKNEAEQCMKEKEEVENALERETRERAKDKERWKERMCEVQKGVEDIVRDLENKLHAAQENAQNAEKDALGQAKDLEKKLAEAQAQRDDAAARAEKAEGALANNQDLGGELRNANDRVSCLMGDLRNANSQIEELEQELVRSEEFVDGLERNLTEHKNILVDLRKTLESKDQQIEAQRIEVRHLEQVHQKTEEMLSATREYITKIEEDASTAVEHAEALGEELETAKEEVKHLKMVAADREAQGEQLAKEAERAAKLARQMEEALEAAEKKMAEDEDDLAAVNGKLTALEREKERQKELSTRSIDHSRLASATAAQVAAHEAEIEALEQELDDATKEIARLNTVLDQSPARKAVDKAKDTKIEMLEQENEALSERIKALKTTMNDFNTPSKMINNSGISPMHRRALSMSIRAPKTPGGPLRDMSWLNSTTADPVNGSPLVAEISRLQRELDRANESIDDKLDKLEDAGLGVVGLTKKLEDARSKIRSLEDHIARLSRREERRLRRLERIRCRKCLTKVDVRSIIHLSEDESSLFETGNDILPSEPPTPPTKTSDALRANLQTVNSQLQETKKQWEDEKRKLLGEKAVLQDAANRLNAEARDAKVEASKASEAQKVNGRLRQDIQGDLEKARRTITELESDLKAERARLRNMTAEQSRVDREKEQIFVQLQRTETDMEDVRTQLQTCKKENRELENELRVNANIDQRAKLLEIKVAENAETMDQLREERALLATDYKELQQRYSEISEHANQLLDSEAVSRKTHDKHRHELDLYLSEIEDLRKALADRSGELHRVEAEKHRIAAERSNVAETVAVLEADLRRVRDNAEAFGRDLKELRLEKERLEKEHQEEQLKIHRAKKQTQTQIRLLTEQLEGQRAKTLEARAKLENHVCAMDDRQLSALKLQHNKEAKGLIVQIRYLKAKFTRESMMRFDLAYQKHYLLVLLNKFEKSEKTISAAIARIGFPVAAPPSRPTKPRLKTIIQSIIFVARVRRASEQWRKQNASRQAIAAALDNVHQRRAATSSKS